MKNLKIIIGRTNKTLTSQGYTYNQAGFSYNQAGVMYGGLTGYDLFPLVSKSKSVKPIIKSVIE